MTCVNDLCRFLDAQDAVWPQVQQELRAARKASHWMWFVFPQLRALGRSPTAQFYGLADLAEARAYLAQPRLAARLREACSLLLAAPPGRSAHDILGSPDDLKLRSSMTLFRRAAPDERMFEEVLKRFYVGEADGLTLALLEGAA